jgi:hypothetical protein
LGALVAYKAYRAGQDRVQELQATLAKYSDAAASAGDILALLSVDIRNFLASDTDEVPRSLRQLAKLARSHDVQDTLRACVASTVKGMLTSPPAAEGMPTEPNVVDKVIEAVLSDRGQSLVALAIKTAAHQSTDTFCSALREGLEAALSSAGSMEGRGSNIGGSGAHQAGASSNGTSFMQDTSDRSPQQPTLQLPHNLHHHHHMHPVMHPALARFIAVMSSTQMLQLIDSLVSTTVGGAVGAYVEKAGSTDMFTNMLNALGKPGNKELVVEMMSSVSAAFCREMAAACVAPAAAVASRPASRLGGAMTDLEQQRQHLAHLPSSSSSSRMNHPAKALRHSHSQGGISAATDDGSEPSTPQSGPGTPEPSVAAATASVQTRESFAGSAVAGLVLRRNSFPGLAGWGTISSSSGPGDLASLGPMSTVVSLFVQAARFQEFRSLMVDVSRSSTREFVLGLLPSGLLQEWPRGTAASAAFTACMYRVYTTVSVMLFLMVYALGPKALVEGV